MEAEEEMQKNPTTPDSLQRDRQAQLPARRDLTFSYDEKRNIFKGMVVSELEAGFLRYSRRQELIKQAARLGIPEFEACLLIAEAQFKAGDIEPIRLDTAATLDHLSRPETWSIPVQLVVAAFIAVCVDLLAIYWLFG
jgi:hypothetical protein